MEIELGKYVAEAAAELRMEFVRKNGSAYDMPEKMVFYMPIIMIDALRHYSRSKYQRGEGIAESLGNERFMGIEIREGYEALVVLTFKTPEAVKYPELTMRKIVKIN